MPGLPLSFGFRVATGGSPQAGDGTSGAPTGTPPLPDILNAYGANRPPWNVAGVDFNVGPASGTSFQDPATFTLPAGVSRLTSPFNFLSVTGNNVTIENLDMNGWRLEVSGNNCTVQNNKWDLTVTMSGQALIYVTGNGITIKNNRVNFNFLSTASDARFMDFKQSSATGTTATVQYNHMLNSAEDMGTINSGGLAQNCGGFDFRFNAWQNNALSDTGHADIIQTFVGTIEDLVYDYNLIYQSTMGNNTQGIGLNAQQNPSEIAIGNWSCQHNTIVTLTGTSVSPIFVYDTSELIGTGTAGFNYFDPSGIKLIGNDGHLYLDAQGGHSNAGTVTLNTNSVNMLTGATVQNWP